MSKIFIDTNILAYCQDSFEEQKQKICRNIVKNIAVKQIGVISTQILQEYYIVATKRLNISPLIAKELIHSFENFEIVTISPLIIKEAIDCSIINQISFWDSLVVCSAEYSKCSQLLTEDLNHKQIIRGVEIINPFKQ